MSSFRFVVPGKPVPKQRPRLVGKNVFTPVETRNYEALVRRHCRKAAPAAPLEGEIALTIVFYLPTKRFCDVDNLVKSLMDGLNGVAYNDDSQVVLLSAEKTYDAEEPRACVWVSVAAPRCETCRMRHCTEDQCPCPAT